MKVKDGRKLLEGYTGDELYHKACLLFRGEVNNLIGIRCHGKKPTEGVVDSAIKQVRDWFIKVADGLPWPDPDLPKNIVSWESGRIWVECGITNPEIERYRNRVRKEMLRGTPFPLAAALTPEALDAMSSMVFAKAQADATLYIKREEFAKGMGKRACSYGEMERFCEHQSTYSMVKNIPSKIEDCAFICNIDSCIKEEH